MMLLHKALYIEFYVFTCCKEANKKKAITKMATITQSGIRYIPIGLFFCFRINYNTPIATMICSLSDKQSFGF